MKRWGRPRVRPAASHSPTRESQSKKTQNMKYEKTKNILKHSLASLGQDYSSNQNIFSEKPNSDEKFPSSGWCTYCRCCNKSRTCFGTSPADFSRADLTEANNWIAQVFNFNCNFKVFYFYLCLYLYLSLQGWPQFTEANKLCKFLTSLVISKFLSAPKPVHAFLHIFSP